MCVRWHAHPGVLSLDFCRGASCECGGTCISMACQGIVYRGARCERARTRTSEACRSKG